MSRICWRFVDVVSRALDSGERDAVCGDIAESGARATQALRDVLGLVLRRQTDLWKNWRPWLSLLALVVPSGMLLNHLSRLISYQSAIYTWLYANNWTAAYVTNSAAAHDLLEYVEHFLTQYAGLAGLSWTSGFLLGALARRTLPVNGALFSLVLVCGEIAVPPYPHGSNAAVFSLTLYSVMFPLMVKIVLVLLPSLMGMRAFYAAHKYNLNAWRYNE